MSFLLRKDEYKFSELLCLFLAKKVKAEEENNDTLIPSSLEDKDAPSPCYEYFQGSWKTTHESKEYYCAEFYLSYTQSGYDNDVSSQYAIPVSWIENPSCIDRYIKILERRKKKREYWKERKKKRAKYKEYIRLYEFFSNIDEDELKEYL